MDISCINTNYEAICKHFDFDKRKSSDINKQILLEMAERNEPKPRQHSGDGLGERLSCYTNPNNAVYDAEFTKKIKTIRPEWFVDIEERMANNKKLFLEMARRGEKRPNKRTHPLGAVFCSYVNPSQKSTYDKKFTEDIMSANPSWLVRKWSLCKQELIEILEKGGPKPSYSTRLGKVFQELIRSDKRDKEFYKLVRNKNPNWLVPQKDVCNNIKEQILKMAKKGFTKEQIKNKVGRKFTDYIRPDKKRNSKFINQLRKLRPDFFVTRHTLASEKKKKVLEFARKDIKPSKELIGDMYQWFYSDPIFTKEFKKINPSWYKSKKQRELEKNKMKDKIVFLAKNGENRPSQKTSLGVYLTNILNKKSKSHDPKLSELLKTARPDWFRK